MFFRFYWAFLSEDGESGRLRRILRSQALEVLWHLARAERRTAQEIGRRSWPVQQVERGAFGEVVRPMFTEKLLEPFKVKKPAGWCRCCRSSSTEALLL